MATILVPAPSKSAFNKHRPISDLLQHQLRHFQHIEAQLPIRLRSTMTPRELSTENGAAQYIAHLTRALKSLHQIGIATPVGIAKPIGIATPIGMPRPARPTRTLAIAAAAQPSGDTRAPSTPKRRALKVPKTKKTKQTKRNEP